jgi:hypothetical protein
MTHFTKCIINRQLSLRDLTFPFLSSIMVSMNRLDTARRAQIVRCLVEGSSIRSTVRMTGASKNTVAKLLVELGAACTQFMDEAMRNLPCKRLQADEIWSFVGCKEKNVTAEKMERDGIVGDVWTWTAIDADSKLIPCWMIGRPIWERHVNLSATSRGDLRSAYSLRQTD